MGNRASSLRDRLERSRSAESDAASFAPDIHQRSGQSVPPQAHASRTQPQPSPRSVPRPTQSAEPLWPQATTDQTSQPRRKYSSSEPRPRDQKEAMTLRELGNEHFKAGKYAEADTLYSQAIIHNSSDPKLFSNRAMTRVKLQDWAGAETDSRKAIELYGERSPAAMKSHYSLAQALLEQRHPEEALTTAKWAYKVCLETKDNSSEILSQFILRTKQTLWNTRETKRLRDLDSTLASMEALLQDDLDRAIKELGLQLEQGILGQTGFNEESASLTNEMLEKRSLLRSCFAKGREDEMAERNVPDYLIDNITFEIMHDPVVTPSGMSYERTGLLKHLKVAGTDPITREKLREDMLIPNHGLKNACAEFLEKNGWAVDY